MQNFKMRFVTVSAAVAALAVFSTTGTASADHGSVCCCQGQVVQQHHAATFHAGDKVVVSGDHAILMKGNEHLTNVPKGHAFQVLKVQGPWLGAEIEKDGKKMTGWISTDQVAAAGMHADRMAGATPQQGERRSFSYDPSNAQPQAPVYQTYPSYRTYSRNRSPRKEPWQYPKTDPRRYGNGL